MPHEARLPSRDHQAFEAGAGPACLCAFHVRGRPFLHGARPAASGRRKHHPHVEANAHSRPYGALHRRRARRGRTQRRTGAARIQDLVEIPLKRLPMPSLADLLQQGTTHAWLFVPTAILLGALHGLEPGHSKTMMAAFIIAVRGTVGQAVLLGLCATISHTAVVWVIALGG